MKLLVVIATLATLANCGLVSHDVDHGEHHKATSYQSIKFEHFHAVPTYVKKEDAHLLKNPIPVGHTGAKLEVHHGGKHDHGYAIADTHSNVQHASHGGDFGGQDFSGHDFGGHAYAGQSLGGGHEGHEEVAQAALAALGGHQEGHGGYEGGEGDYHQLQQAALAQDDGHEYQGHYGHEESSGSQGGAQSGYQQHAGLGLGHYQ